MLSEKSGILNRWIEGYQHFEEGNGLPECAAVERDTLAYLQKYRRRSDEEVLSGFFQRHLKYAAGGGVSGPDVTKVLQSYCLSTRNSVPRGLYRMLELKEGVGLSRRDGRDYFTGVQPLEVKDAA